MATAFIHVGSAEAHLEIRKRLGFSREGAIKNLTNSVNAAIEEGEVERDVIEGALDEERLKMRYLLCQECSKTTGFDIGPAIDPPVFIFDREAD